MGDKHKSEIQKPVKNTLLSGASHGFPFENFQGSSLLIPVSHDSPSVLNDSAGDANKLGSKELKNSENYVQLKEKVCTSTSESILNASEAKSTPSTASQGYSGLFSAFLSGGSQKKEEFEIDQTQRKNSEHPSVTLASFSTHTSPFGTPPPVQSFTPILEVPTTGSELSHNNDSFNSSGAPVSVNTSIDPSERHFQPNIDTFSALNENPRVPSSFSKPEVPVVSSLKLNQSEQNQVQSFFNKDNTSNVNLGFDNLSSVPDIGFESFYNSAPENVPTTTVLTKAQSAIDLIREGHNEFPSSTGTFFSNPHQPHSSAPQFYQTRTGSADSITPFQPPPFGIPSSLSAPLGAPPMSSGVSAKNYRRDHHKRLAYAPVPGLTSNTAVVSSYLQPCNNTSTPTSVSSSALISPSGALKQPLSGSLSQPALNVSHINSESNFLSNSSSTSSNSLQNFFSSHSANLSTEDPQSAAKFVSSFAKGASVSFDTNSQTLSTNNVNSEITVRNRVNETPNSPVPPLPLTIPSSLPCPDTFSPHAVHPPIMSTREQPQPLAPTTRSERSPSPMIIPPSLNNLANLGISGIIYRPVYHHWFVRVDVKDSKEIWQPFSMNDSLALEQAFNSDKLTPDTIIPTDGGRYDVNVTRRTRVSVFWEEEPKIVRRCSWFYKSTTESRLHPYDENTAYNLEEEFKKAVTTNTWSRKVDLPSGDYVIMYGPSSMALFQSAPQTPEGWDAEPDYSQTEQRRPKIVKRGVLDDFDIDEGESPIVDHLVFVVHGIGSVCDFRFRTIEEAVDGFRAKSLQLIKSHFRTSVEQGVVNRVEVLPVSWHNHLHGENTGVDKKLQTITLKSIPRLRHFTNDTLLDILFYTSPVYCQNIVQQVGREINNLYAKFKIRNPDFTGGISLVGHSLGSLILFDMLCHQKPPSPRMEHIKEEAKATVVQQDVTTVVSPDKKNRSLSRNVSYVIGNAGTGQPFIEYPQLTFQPLAFFAMGSPIGMFVTVRGIDSLGLDFCLPTCSRFFNIFHPFDPVAYRIEALVNPDLADRRPVLIPHHKGRKRMHLELKETMARVGADLKQRLVDSVRSTWNTVYQLTMFGRADDGLEQEVDQVIEKQLERQRTESVGAGISESEDTDFNAGRLNQGRRIDYVLQEAPLESFNEYVSALTSHVIYWDSEDTMLLILKEIYGSMGISTDNQNSAIPGPQEQFSPTQGPSTSTYSHFPPR